MQQTLQVLGLQTMFRLCFLAKKTGRNIGQMGRKESSIMESGTRSVKFELLTSCLLMCDLVYSQQDNACTR